MPLDPVARARQGELRLRDLDPLVVEELGSDWVFGKGKTPVVELTSDRIPSGLDAVQGCAIGVGAADAELVAAERWTANRSDGRTRQVLSVLFVDRKPCFSQLIPICSNRPSINRYMFCAMTGCCAEVSVTLPLEQPPLRRTS